MDLRSLLVHDDSKPSLPFPSATDPVVDGPTRPGRLPPQEPDPDEEAEGEDGLRALPGGFEMPPRRELPPPPLSGPPPSLALAPEADDEEADVDAGYAPPIAPADPAAAAAEAAMARGSEQIGRTLGGYRIVEILGHGGMGMVYKATQVSLDRVVALKVLNKALVDNQEFIKRFRREAKAMGSIHHPNIVSVIDFNEQDGLWYMVAEFVEGTNLARLIKEKLIVPQEELVPLMVQCLGGLAHVSKQGVVHRDIKPDNILIDRDNVAKIADFGLAKDVNSEDSDLTAAGSAMGTPAYMSPEQCMGRRLDVRSDIYSFGVTAWFALTGEKPFQGKSSFEIMTKQRELMPEPPHEVNPRVHPEVSAVVMHMLAKLPQDRFPDADACREAWIQLGQRLGVLGPVTRSGEYLFTPPAADNPSPRTPPSLPPMSPLPPPPPSVGDPGGLSPVSDRFRSTPSDVFAPLSSEAPPPLGPSTERSRASGEQVRPGTERGRRDTPPGTGTGTERRAVRTGDSVTCPRCGHLNRSGRNTCEHCNHSLRGDERGLEGQLQEAERLFRSHQYRDAAAIYGRLAELETDRRQRSVLRTKERDARAKLEEEQYRTVSTRLSQLVDAGDLHGGIRVVERALQDSGLSGQLSSRLSDERQRIHGLLRRRRRGRTMLLLFLLVLIAAGVIGYIQRDQLLPLLERLRGPVQP